MSHGSLLRRVFPFPGPRRAALVALVLAVIPAAAAPAAPTPLEAEFKLLCRAMIDAKLAGTGEDVIARNGWVLLTTELRYAAGGAFWGDAAREANPNAPPDAVDPLPAILDFKARLAARGITLIFMPVPTRPVVYPESVLGEARIGALEHVPNLHTPEHEFLALLRSRGVTVVELTPLLLSHRADPHAPMFVPSDSHWTGSAIAVASAEVTRIVRALPFYAGAPRQRYVTEWKERVHAGHIYRDIHEHGKLPERPGDRMWLRTSMLDLGAELKPIGMRNPASPVVLIGDSNTLCWGDRNGALFQQLAADLGFPVDELATTGGGATNCRLNFVRTALAEPGYLDGKKVVVWCFTSRSFHNSGDGWRIVPLDKPPAP
jgi:hypothetical protein